MSQRTRARRVKLSKNALRRLLFESLESRRLLAISPEALEFVYELNLVRSDPQAYEDAAGLPEGLLDGVASRPPLALNDNLSNSAEFHADEMAEFDYFAHQSAVTGDHPNQMVLDAGYPLHSSMPPDANYVESLAAGTFLGDANDALALLIEDAGLSTPGHRYHLLATGPNHDFWQQHREVGVGHAFDAGATYRNYWAIHTAYRDATPTFLTGVAFDDANGNGSFDAGEGLAGVTIDVGGTEPGGVSAQAITNAAGGWSLAVAAGEYLITASGAGLAGVSTTVATVDADNVQVDFVSGQADGFVNFVQTPGPPAPAVLAELLASDGQGPGAAAVTDAQIAAIVAEAVARWERTDPRAAAAQLDQLAVAVADLDPGVLMLLTDAGLQVDRDAAGWGWHLDATPGDDGEFTSPSGRYEWLAESGNAAVEFDLLSAVMHGMGRQLGHLDDSASDSQPGSDQLDRGMRRLPYAVDVLPVGEVRAGIPARDGAEGAGFVLFSEQPVHDRFDVNPLLGGSRHLIAVTLDEGQWYYDNNARLLPFEPVASDVLIAEVDFSADTITSLQGQMGELHGVRRGFLDGDLVMTAEVFGPQAAPNAGEFIVQGTWFQAAASGGANRHLLGNLRAGVAARDNAQGSGYLMWSEQLVHERFEPAPTLGNSHQLVAVQYLGGQWHYDNNSGLHPFTPSDTDVLLAAVDFSADAVALLQAESVIHGIRAGFVDGDLSIVANEWGARVDPGEFAIAGTWFETSAGQRQGSGAIWASDTAVGSGYILHSVEPLDQRLGVSLNGGSPHFAVVVLAGGQWQVDVNGPLHPLAPVASDTLVAEVDYGADTVRSLAGQWGSLAGIAWGYAYGDLSFVANQWRGQANDGEFDVLGTHFAAHPPLAEHSLGDIHLGVAARDGAVGEGYLMWSAQSVFARFSPSPLAGNSDHLIAVTLVDGQWHYDNNGSLQPFAPQATDLLLASVDFSADTVTSLEDEISVIEGIRSGYRDGDLEFYANRWGAGENAGEFRVEGTRFTR